MIDVKCFQCNMLQENCYVVSDETQDAVIIDCGAYYEEELQAIIDFIDNKQLTLRHQLLTHAHFDHVFGCDAIYKSYGLKPEMHADEDKILAGMQTTCRELLMLNWTKPFPPVNYLHDGDIISFGSHGLKVLHVPGHTPGGIIFFCEEEHIAFSGDTLFRFSVGRTDLPYGSWKDLSNSLHTVVMHLPADTLVYPGHGPMTTIADELVMNPYFT